MKFLPRSLLWRTFLLIAALLLLSVLAWFNIFNAYEREPRARQLSQMLASVANLTRAALVSARPEARRELLRELSAREGIRVYPAEPDDRIAPLPDRPVLKRVEILLREKLGPLTRLTLERNGERALFVSFRIDDSEDGDFWLALPRERIDRFLPLEWLGWGAAALILSLLGAWLVVAHVARPLRILAKAAGEIGRGRIPAAVPEAGPSEVQSLAQSFNQMSAGLSRLDQDRALILAGVSHDLRTPLTRLRMGIEMSDTDESLKEGMVADIEEMDRTIGQFLDFARPDGGEAIQPVDLGALLAELASQYGRRGARIEATIASLPPRDVRPGAMRRAIANLIENALRHGGTDVDIALALRATDGHDLIIEVADRGPGIPPADTERMKLPFTQIESARSGAAGAGLGLAIVDRVAQSHGGRLELLPREGGGLVARLILPAP